MHKTYFEFRSSFHQQKKDWAKYYGWSNNHSCKSKGHTVLLDSTTFDTRVALIGCSVFLENK